MDANVLISVITVVGSILGIYAASKFGTSKEDRAEQRATRTENKALEAKCRSLEDYSQALRGDQRLVGNVVTRVMDALSALVSSQSNGQPVTSEQLIAVGVVLKTGDIPVRPWPQELREDPS